MKPIHPSTIKLRDNHCGHAIEMWKQNAPYERDVFHTGVAAHYVLEMCALNPDENVTVVAQECIQELTIQGRSYDDVPEPPMPVNRAVEGAKIATDWLQFNTLPTENAFFEEEYAFDKDWNEVPYNSDEAVFQTILDVVEIHHEYDEQIGEEIKHAIVRDYKTSWAADSSELYTVQRHCQALVVWLRHKPEKITLEIANLRSKKFYNRVIRPLHDEEDLEGEWKTTINTYVELLSQPQRPSPGTGCVNCPYTRYCKYADEAYANGDDILTQYAVAKALVDKLAPQVKKLVKEEPVKVGTGYIGYKTKERTKVLPETGERLTQMWQEQDGDVAHLVEHLELGVTSLKKILRIICKNPRERKELTEQLTQKESYASFGVHKK